MNYSKIEGHENLLRDLKTGAIINTNINEYEDYIRTKKINENEL